MGNKGAAIICLVLATTVAEAMRFTEWSPAVSAEAVWGTDETFNTPFQDGCPAPSKDGLSIYMASNRPGGHGGLDIWVATRESADDPFGPPMNLGAPVNTPADEFCPTPLTNGRELLFVSTKPGGCGGSDMYSARHHRRDGWKEPQHLGCLVNSPADEASPAVVQDEDGQQALYFSSTRAGGYSGEAPGTITGDSDIYVSFGDAAGGLSAPMLALGLNTEFQDARPHVRRDGREIVFDSNRPGGIGGLDIWSATREQTSDAWLLPENLGPAINSAGNETRPFLSFGATTLYFGTNRGGVEGAADIFVAWRAKARH